MYAIRYHQQDQPENKGIRIDGKYLPHLVADNIVLIAKLHLKATGNVPRDLWHQQASRSEDAPGEDQVMRNKHVNKDDVIADWKKIEEVDRYVYLGRLQLRTIGYLQEVRRRPGQGWNAFCKLGNIM